MNNATSKTKIGLIGYGFVGKAVATGFSSATGGKFDILVYDKDPSRSINPYDEVINKSDFVFISVPTPSKADGSVSLKYIDEVLDDLSNNLDGNSPIVLLRSTIPPGTSQNYANRYKNLKLVFNPEFLTERQAIFDFISQTRVILGGPKEHTAKVADLYRSRFGSALSILETSFESAELIKYMCNTFFATKVSFMNEMKLLSDSSGADWEHVKEGFIRDGRVGVSHTNVPGPDGRAGFGGSCFPKDIQALLSYAKDKGINLNVLDGAWKTNLEVRPERDWEELKGRAVEDE